MDPLQIDGSPHIRFQAVAANHVEAMFTERANEFTGHLARRDRTFQRNGGNIPTFAEKTIHGGQVPGIEQFFRRSHISWER
jgi:hypothetical protein